MARKRMFDMEIVDTDLFLDMPQSSQNLYFHLGMRADDDGFVSNPKKIIKIIGANEDDLKLLFLKKFVIPFESGVCVITHWKLNNYLRRDRYTETIYKNEKRQLVEDENGVYSLGTPPGIPNGNQCVTNGIHSIEENSIEENREEKKSKGSKKESFDDLIDSYTFDEELREELKNHLATRKAKKAALTNRAIELSLKKLDELVKNIPINDQEQMKLKIVQQSIEHGYIGFFPLKENSQKQYKKNDGWDYLNDEINRLRDNDKPF